MATLNVVSVSTESVRDGRPLYLSCIALELVYHNHLYVYFNVCGTISQSVVQLNIDNVRQ